MVFCTIYGECQNHAPFGVGVYDLFDTFPSIEFQTKSGNSVQAHFHNIFKPLFHDGAMENGEIVKALNKITDILDARLEEISNKLDDITASLQNLIIEEAEMEEENEEE